MNNTSVINKLKDLIKNSETFGVVVSENPQDYEFLAGEALKKAFLTNGMPALGIPHKNPSLQKKWSPIIKTEAAFGFPQKTAIKLPKEKYEIKEVSYKEDGNNLSLVITSNSNEICHEDISLEKLPAATEAVFCLFENEDKTEEFKTSLEFPKDENIVFVTANNKTLTEKTFDIINIINPKTLNEPEMATILYASLVSETHNFSEKTNQEILDTGSFLLQNGADKKTISEILEQDKNMFFTQILGRALARTYSDEALNASWSFLNSRDFQKTNNSASISPVFLYKLIRKISNITQERDLHILIWQGIEGIQAMVAAGKNKTESYLLPLAQTMNSQTSSPYFTAGPFKNFSEAEIRIKKAISEQ